MHFRKTWPVGFIALCALVAMSVGGSRGQEGGGEKKLTAEEVAGRWAPRLKSATDYQHFGGPAPESPGVAAYSFRVVGPGVREVWEHYARLCGVKQEYAEKTFLVSGGASPEGTYVVSERPAGDGSGGRGPSVFLLKTPTYTLSVTFQPDAGGKSISGTLTATVP